MVRVFDQGPTPPQAIIVLGSLGSTLAQGSLLVAWLVWSDAPFPAVSSGTGSLPAVSAASG
jgi:hypothetical protein